MVDSLRFPIAVKQASASLRATFSSLMDSLGNSLAMFSKAVFTQSCAVLGSSVRKNAKRTVTDPAKKRNYQNSSNSKKYEQ